MARSKSHDDRLLTTKEVADYLRLDLKTVRRLLEDGDLAGYKLERVWRISDSDLRKYLRERWRG